MEENSEQNNSLPQPEIKPKIIKLKRCDRCLEEKDIKLFNRQKTSIDKRHPWCKKCQSLDNAVYYAQNRDKRLKYIQNWRAKRKLEKIELEKQIALQNLIAEPAEPEAPKNLDIPASE